MKWEQNYVAQAAQQKRIIPGFNIFGYEDAQAVIRAAERAVCPVLLMINRDARTAMAVEHWSALLNALAESSSVPVGIHLDRQLSGAEDRRSADPHRSQRSPEARLPEHDPYRLR